MCMLTPLARGRARSPGMRPDACRALCVRAVPVAFRGIAACLRVRPLKAAVLHPGTHAWHDEARVRGWTTGRARFHEYLCHSTQKLWLARGGGLNLAQALRFADSGSTCTHAWQT